MTYEDYRETLETLGKCEAALNKALDKLISARTTNRGPDVIAIRRKAEAAERSVEQALEAAVAAWRNHWNEPRDYPMDNKPEAPSLKRSERLI